MKEKFTLKKKERLKSQKSIDALFNTGHRFTVLPFRILYKLSSDGVKFGAGVSSKHFKKAADRNRVKRLMRETYRLQKNELVAMLTTNSRGMDIFLIYTDKQLPEYKRLFEVMRKILEKLIAVANENNSPAA